MIFVKRVYEPPATNDGVRFLVDRLWPRGLTKEVIAIRAWCKEAAPSNELRCWYNHLPERWEVFKRRYFAELEEHHAAWQQLIDAARQGNVTLLYGSRQTEHNNADALKEFLARKLHTAAVSKSKASSDSQ